MNRIYKNVQTVQCNPITHTIGDSDKLTC